MSLKFMGFTRIRPVSDPEPGPKPDQKPGLLLTRLGKKRVCWSLTYVLFVSNTKKERAQHDLNPLSSPAAARLRRRLVSIFSGKSFFSSSLLLQSSISSSLLLCVSSSSLFIFLTSYLHLF